MRTAVCKRLAIDYPIIQAAIGGAADPPLAAAVSAAGGLGMLTLIGRGAARARSRIQELRQSVEKRAVAVSMPIGGPVRSSAG
jgi:nitronate monooxygenase